MNALRSCPFRMFAVASGLALLVLLVVFGGIV